MDITFGSVCSGIEAASVAWHPLGWRAAWLSEIEPYPCSLLSHHYPDVPNLGDMTKIAHLIRDGFAPAPDVFCGGTPCQAFSIAGLRNSLDDARGNLSLIFCEIANEIDARRAADGLLPTTVFWENVPGVLNTKDNAFGCFLGALAGEDSPLEPPGDKWSNAGVVYGPQRAVAWRVLDAQYFGVAQRRRRVFVVASARDGFDPAKVLFEFDGVRRDSAPRRQAGQDAAAATLRSTDGGCDVDHATGGHLQPVECFGGNRTSGPIDISPALNACGTASGRMDFESEAFLVQPVSAYAFQPRIGRNGRGDMGDLVSALTAQAGETGKGDAAPCVAVAYRDAMGMAHWPDAQCVTGDITHTLKAEGFDASEDGAGRGQPIVAACLNPQETQRRRIYDGNGIAPCLSSEEGRGHGVPSILTQMAVRRLTPRECERLQGFPDDYTLIPHGRTVSEEKLDRDFLKYQLRGNPKHLTRADMGKLAADGPRYKALGNSWAVPNVRWLGRRIEAELARLDA